MISDQYFKSNIICEDIQNINKVSNKSIFEDSWILITGADGMIARRKVPNRYFVTMKYGKRP